MDMPLITQKIAEIQAYYGSFTTEQVITYTVVGGLGSLIVLWALKNSFALVLRPLGLYHPAMYRWIPRYPWRTVVKIALAVTAWWERVRRHGLRQTAGFASVLSVLSELYAPAKLLLGRAYGFGLPFLQPVGIKVSRHLMAFAMTGAGKTVALTTILQCWRGSALIVDPKGQITGALAGKDRKRKWRVFDPYGITEFPSIGINIFDVIKWAMERGGADMAVLWAQRIAQCLIVTPQGTKTPYFNDISRGFVTGLILYVLAAYEEDSHNLPFVRTLIVQGLRVFDPVTAKEETQGTEGLELLLAEMKRCPAFGGVVSGGAAAVQNAGRETLGNIISTLQEQTKWLDIPSIRHVLMHSGISLADLKTRNDVVLSLVAPVLSIREELKDCFRLIINMTAYVFETEKKKRGQCLFVVDELPSLGHNPVFEVLLPVARSYGITFFGIAQDLEILKKAYPKSWEGFIGNADAALWMASNHEETLAYLSKTLGRCTLIETDRHTGRKSYREVDVMSADQLRRFLNPDSGRLIVTRAGKRALKLVNEPYFKALPVWAYDSDPDHADGMLRFLTRTMLLQHPKRHKPRITTSAQVSDSETPTSSTHPSQEICDDNIILFPGNQPKEH